MDLLASSDNDPEKAGLQFQGFAGGHANRFRISKDGRVLIKRASLEEAHFYIWLRRLPHADDPSRFRRRADGEGQTLPVTPLCPLGCTGGCPVLRLEKSAWNCNHADTAKKLLLWVPECHETTKVIGDEAGSKTPAKLVLENLLFGLENPVVVDIKMGTRLYGDLATAAKIERASRYASQRGAANLGLSFCGLWGKEGANEFKWEGGSRLRHGCFRPTTLEVYVELFRAFMVSVGDPVGVARQLVSQLQSLRKDWHNQKIVNVYGSSLLIVAGSAFTEKKVTIKMIDFAHATLYPKEKDSGYLKGIESLISAVGEAAHTWHTGTGSGGCVELLAVWQARGNENKKDITRQTLGDKGGRC